ncbi:hypothetical protein SAMN03159453_04864 [Pseudomonas sp. NFIX28]|nr:hypothetical protein SAMN03159453_04864 [Pseudomonas sp. NFIX28]
MKEETPMNKNDKPGSDHSFADDPEKVKNADKKIDPAPEIKTDRAEKARIGGQHSHGGNRDGKER